MTPQAEDPTAKAIAQMSLANAALFFSLVDAVLTQPSERTPQRIAEYVRANYEAMGDQRSAAGSALIGFIASKLEGAQAESEGAASAV